MIPDGFSPEIVLAAIKERFPQAKIYMVEQPDKITATCLCCGISQDFKDAEEAFNSGWDTPPHFTGYACCNLCPGSFVVLGVTEKHEPDHKRWEQSGRPETFSVPRDSEGNVIT